LPKLKNQKPSALFSSSVYESPTHSSVYYLHLRNVTLSNAASARRDVLSGAKCSETAPAPQQVEVAPALESSAGAGKRTA